MRLFAPLSLVLALACSGAPSLPTSGAPSAGAPAASPPTTGASAGTATAVPDPEAALGDHWLVILGSKRDPAEAIPGLDVVRAHPELGASPGTLRSSRFKGLMPCFTVTTALATIDKKQAVEVSKKLRDLGVDNYVKNAGPYVGKSAALDAWCAAAEAPEPGDVRVGAIVDGGLWLPERASDAEVAAAVAASPPPEPRGEGYAAWYQPVGNRPVSTANGTRYRVVDATTGRMQVCSAIGAGILTLGTPHFGVLQAPEPPTTPQCGSPAIFEQVSCPDPVAEGQHWVAVPEAGQLFAYEKLGEGGALEAAARAALETTTEWKTAAPRGDEPDMAVERSVAVTRWRGPTGEVALVQGSVAVGNGVCGGEDTTWIGVFAVAEGTLGARMGGWIETSFATAAGLVDVGGDGRPEVVIERFPETTALVDTDGSTVGELAIDYCDCPC